MRLTAEREGQPRRLGRVRFYSHEDARWYVEAREEAGTWPEGHDAVITDTRTGERWTLVDGWVAL